MIISYGDPVVPGGGEEGRDEFPDVFFKMGSNV